MRAALDDLRNRNKKNHLKTFKNYSDSNQCISCDNFFLFLRDIFVTEDNFRLFFDSRDIETIFQKSNSVKIILNFLEDFFFEVVHVNRSMYPNGKLITMDYDLFWVLFYYLLETKKIVYTYSLQQSESISQLKEELKITLEEYKQKYEESQDPIEKNILKNTIDSIKRQIENFDSEETPKNKLRQYEGNWRKALREIFVFYAKLQKGAKKEKTFDSYKNELASMTVGEWLKLLKDFELNPSLWDKDSREKYKKISQDVTTQVGPCDRRN
jgi:hypothetical protein